MGREHGFRLSGFKGWIRRFQTSKKLEIHQLMVDFLDGEVRQLVLEAMIRSQAQHHCKVEDAAGEDGRPLASLAELPWIYGLSEVG